jgi:hypothetical protein
LSLTLAPLLSLSLTLALALSLSLTLALALLCPCERHCRDPKRRGCDRGPVLQIVRHGVDALQYLVEV